MKPIPGAILTLLVLCGLVSGCTNNKNRLNSQQPANSNTPVSSRAATKPVVDIPRLIGKSPAELEKVLGKSVGLTKITDDPELMPGEYRDYKIANSPGQLTPEGLMVRFHKGKAVHFTLDLPGPTDTPEEALLLAGIDVKGTEAGIKAPRADRWSGYFNGLYFKDIAALRMFSGGNKYGCVQAESIKLDY
jgi:hypothetical protein